MRAAAPENMISAIDATSVTMRAASVT